jgi:hypothetical protein
MGPPDLADEVRMPSQGLVRHHRDQRAEALGAWNCAMWLRDCQKQRTFPRVETSPFATKVALVCLPCAKTVLIHRPALASPRGHPFARTARISRQEVSASA